MRTGSAMEALGLYGPKYVIPNVQGPAAADVMLDHVMVESNNNITSCIPEPAFIALPVSVVDASSTGYTVVMSVAYCCGLIKAAM